MNFDNERPTGAADAHGDADSLHVITLLSSNTPMPLRPLSAPELGGLAVFRSRRVEDGRERFRIHLGYFQSAAEAEQVLAVARATYPGAFVAVAPQTNLGSLDDTGVARFSILKPVDTIPNHAAAEVAPVTPAEAPAPAAAPAAAPAPVAPALAALVAAMEPDPSLIERMVAPVPAEPRVGLPPMPVPVLTAVDIVSRPARAPTPAASQPAAIASQSPPTLEIRRTQRYAVQLIVSKMPIDLGKMARLEIFDGYLLYAVETGADGRRQYGVRLGFYDDALSARLVAQYVRPEFKGVAVVPVSDRETSRASAAMIRLPLRRAVGAPPPRVPWPRGALTLANGAAATQA